MRKVLAALGNSLADTPVIGCARAVAELLDAEVEALHVRVDGSRTARSTAEAAGIPLRVVSGDVVECLVREGADDDVLALTIGARGTPQGSRPLGGTAEAVATALLKPVVIVPPEARVAHTIRSVLVPLEGTLSSSLAPRSIFELARDARIEAVALHIVEEHAIPAFTDQPQHEQAAWAEEFLLRYCPWGIDDIRLETRIGRAGEIVPVVAEQCGCDLIALGWSRQLASGRAPVVRQTLEHSRLPVLLVPVELAPRLDTRHEATEDAWLRPPA